MRNSYVILAIIALTKRVLCLLCNGDFEAYAIPAGSEFARVSSNSSCWYQRSGGQFEIQKALGLNMTQVVELALDSPNILCQNVTLVTGKMYRLNFSIYNHFTMHSSQIRVLVNNQAAFNHTTSCENTFSDASYIMTAQSTNTQICFNYSLAPSWSNPSLGPCLDNVTLELYVPIFISSNRSTILCNGDFETYVMPGGSEYVGVLPNYSCWYDRAGGVIEVQRKVNLNTTNVAELAYYYPYVLCQNVSLEVDQEYQLNFTVFNQQSMETSEIRVLINNESAFNQTTLGQYNRSNASFAFKTSSKNTQVCFDFFLGLAWPNSAVAPCLDNITIQLQHTSLNSSNFENGSILTQNYKEYLYWVLSFPGKLSPTLRMAYLFIDDLWLYYYNNKTYTGLIQVVFQTVAEIQIIKFDFFERFFGWNKYKQSLRISEYRPYSMKRFVEVEGTSSVLLDSNFTFFIYTVPQNIIFCVILFFLFRILRKHRFKFLKKFYFLKSNLTVALLEENLVYFVFVCFSQLQEAFDFSLADKISLIFTILFFFALTLFTFCFYLMLFRYLDERDRFFSEYTCKESASFWYRTFSLCRNFLRATIFCFFHNHYSIQLLMLSAVEVVMILISVALQSSSKFFISTAMYKTSLLYYLLLISLNCALLSQTLVNATALPLVKKIEQIIIYSLIGNIILMFIIDIFISKPSTKTIIHPLKNHQKKQLFSQDQQNIQTNNTPCNSKIIVKSIKIVRKQKDKRQVIRVKKLDNDYLSQTQKYKTTYNVAINYNGKTLKQRKNRVVKFGIKKL